MHTVGEAQLRQVLDQELHDLSQPMASLQCRLEIGSILGGEEALREAVDGGLEDLQRLSTALQRMRVLISVATDETYPAGAAR